MWPWEERDEKSGWYSVLHAAGNREYCSEDSGGLAETHASGNREYTRKVVHYIKDQLRHDESISEVSINSEKMHISIWTRFMASSMHAALHMDPSYENNLELFTHSEFENIKGLFGITRMMIEGNSEIRRCEFTLGKLCCLKNKQQSGQKQECTPTRTPCDVAVVGLITCERAVLGKGAKVLVS